MNAPSGGRDGASERGVERSWAEAKARVTVIAPPCAGLSGSSLSSFVNFPGTSASVQEEDFAHFLAEAECALRRS